MNNEIQIIRFGGKSVVFAPGLMAKLRGQIYHYVVIDVVA